MFFVLFSRLTLRTSTEKVKASDEQSFFPPSRPRPLSFFLLSFLSLSLYKPSAPALPLSCERQNKYTRKDFSLLLSLVKHTNT